MRLRFLGVMSVINKSQKFQHPTHKRKNCLHSIALKSYLTS